MSLYRKCIRLAPRKGGGGVVRPTPPPSTSYAFGLCVLNDLSLLLEREDMITLIQFVLWEGIKKDLGQSLIVRF